MTFPQFQRRICSKKRSIMSPRFLALCDIPDKNYVTGDNMWRTRMINSFALHRVQSTLGLLRKGVVSGVAVASMLVVYAVGSISSYGVAALGLTGATGLALATTAQPAQAHRYRRRRRRRGYRGWGWGPGIYLNVDPFYRRRRRRRGYYRGYW